MITLGEEEKEERERERRFRDREVESLSRGYKTKLTALYRFEQPDQPSLLAV